jgi:SAM-dependent methyltransferase
VIAEAEVKAQVRDFYDSVGWRQIGEGLYQNARYEDLRPVSREYIHRCHLRLGRYLPREGRYLLDAGSGPIQYPEYLDYSRGFRRRVCLDISRRALVEARARIGEHGLFIVGDIANLPFSAQVFAGVVSLHTIHHLPSEEHQRAFLEFYRVLRPAGSAAVVYSWGSRSPLMRLAAGPIALAFGAQRLYGRVRRGRRGPGGADRTPTAWWPVGPSSTFTYKHDYRWVVRSLGMLPGLEVRVWRTVSTSFLRAFIHRRFLGQTWLRWLYWCEERAPRLLGRIGQYPAILFSRPAANDHPKERVT